jgi:xylan 1,4-beta-xylosidase
LVWNYHDDLVDAPPARVTLRVSVPSAIGTSEAGASVRVTHTRVDATHGDAFSVWASQGSPEAPSAPQLAALRQAMLPVVLDPEHVAPVVGGAVTLAFDLPRFGVSLIELVPSKGSEQKAPPRSRSGSCQSAASSHVPRTVPVALSASLVGLCYLRRFAARERRGLRRKLAGAGERPTPCDGRSAQ